GLPAPLRDLSRREPLRHLGRSPLGRAGHGPRGGARPPHPLRVGLHGLAPDPDVPPPAPPAPGAEPRPQRGGAGADGPRPGPSRLAGTARAPLDAGDPPPPPPKDRPSADPAAHARPLPDLHHPPRKGPPGA